MKSVLKPVLASLLLIGLLGSHVPLPLHAQAVQTLTIFAASSLTDAFNEIATTFKESNPDADVQFNFGSSSTLATQLKEGAPADIFASANNTQMQVAVTAGRIAGKPVTFAKNRLILIVPADNPAGITGLKDLAKDGVKLVLAADKVPVRDYTNTMLDRLVTNPDYGQAYKDAVLKNVVSEEANVRQVSLKVSLGEADAGIVYRSDVTPDITDKVLAFPIPDALNTLASYPIAVTNDAAEPELAQAFIDLVTSEAGQSILIKWNFISADIPELPATIALPTDGKLHLGGQVLNPLALTVDDLKANYASQTISVEYLSGEETIKANYTGVLLRDLLDDAQVNLNADVKNDKLSTFIVATGADGYQAVIAWGEIDPDFGNQPILVAYASDGNPLSDGTFRLLVPNDKRDGRYVSQLVSLEVRDAPSVAK
jgi:molybdate transport system substrate-binding protein